MTRLQHVHARVRHAAGHRKPVAHGPAFRLTALMTGLAIATTAFAVTSPRASAAERAATRRPAPDAAPATARTVAAAVPDRASAKRMGSAVPPEPGPERPDLGPAGEQPPLLDIPDLGIAPQVFPTPPDTAPPGAEPEDTAPTGPAPQGVAPENAPPEGTEPQDAEQQNAPPQGAEQQEPASQGLVLPDGMPPAMPESRRLEQGLAKKVLRGNGVRWSSTGGCSKRNATNCTSFDKIRWGTVKGVIRFAKASGCDVTVTGGTERGHASGPHSHWNGYKADIAPSRCVDRAIRRFPSAGVRGDGAKLHRSPDGVLFAREQDHWDITFP